MSKREAKAIILKIGKDQVLFQCPNCGRKYGAPIYETDFICSHCFQIPYRFNYETKSREYKVWKDTFLTLTQ